MSPEEYLELAEGVLAIRAALAVESEAAGTVTLLDDVIEDIEGLAGNAWVREQRSE